ncbi:hypothetical protein AB0M95_39045 [Sphaerisporangium sp. NPDC051017]|uniref:hypothetical protein n=1 Tax=Sphaerisporangium sp. NPDC051017 TaxID=3154636 RepID=UPI00342122F7
MHSYGADELQRFLDGAHNRGEIALIIATMGRADDNSPRSVMSRYDAGVYTTPPFYKTHVGGRRLPTGTKPRLADEVPHPERDLGLRLLTRPADAPWWAMELAGSFEYPGTGGPPVAYEPAGTLVPILVDGLGAPVAAVWISPEADQRIYLIPDDTDGNVVLDWLVAQALPEYVPGALRRARSPYFVDPALQTAAETAARLALANLEADYAVERARRESELQRAKAAAEPVRYGLLYGTGDELEDAVAAVLQAAGFATVNLDEELGASKSADLLATYGPERRVIEVKSAAGNAPEKLVAALERHLATWPSLCPDEPVGAGVLVVNHQHRKNPHDRSAQVYERPEFVNSLKVVVLSSRDLFTWWATGDWPAIRHAVLGTTPATLPPAATMPPPPDPGDRTAPRKLRWPWKRGGH